MPESGFAKKPPELSWRPGFLIRRLHQIHVSIYLQICERFGTTPVQSSVMQVLQRRPGIDQATLGSEIGLDRTNTSSVLARLEKRGIVKREIAVEDRRTKLAFLTEEGREMIGDMQSYIDAAHAKLLEPLPKSEREKFVTQLRLLVASNNEHSRTPLRQMAAIDRPLRRRSRS
ncbi:transcriptional regulator, MarR family [Rhizobiales bacterium GAS191]|jgi:DNA-binding MarR family transcriptional regulator|nr:transcriptional regulator, MarR family [Rhizobiales bacterium GAS113]SEE16527.1 transcriptional regulator, MarR family [Rhizobiales bacterium GAS191]SEE38811.1 transcriptional regulator, MarR family [Rhizobiales bacterium GAS188]